MIDLTYNQFMVAPIVSNIADAIQIINIDRIVTILNIYLGDTL